MRVYTTVGIKMTLYVPNPAYYLGIAHAQHNTALLYKYCSNIATFDHLHSNCINVITKSLFLVLKAYVTFSEAVD